MSLSNKKRQASESTGYQHKNRAIYICFAFLLWLGSSIVTPPPPCENNLMSGQRSVLFPQLLQPCNHLEERLLDQAQARARLGSFAYLLITPDGAS